MLKTACAAASLVFACGCGRAMGNAAVEGGQEGATLPSSMTPDAPAPAPVASAVPAGSTSASVPVMPPSRDLVVSARMEDTTVKRTGKPVILFKLQNTTKAPLLVPHPTVTTAAVTLRVTLPSGDVRVIYSAPEFPGAPPETGNIQLVPGRVESFAMYLGTSLTFDQPGSYQVDLEYPWRPGQVWTSTLHFIVQ